jgi:hypothetical protein
VRQHVRDSKRQDPKKRKRKEKKKRKSRHRQFVSICAPISSQHVSTLTVMLRRPMYFTLRAHGERPRQSGVSWASSAGTLDVDVVVASAIFDAVLPSTSGDAIMFSVAFYILGDLIMGPSSSPPSSPLDRMTAEWLSAAMRFPRFL